MIASHPRPDSVSCNAALSACSRGSAWPLSLLLLEQLPRDMISGLTLVA